jgi:tetratricopeptide (TPR) repeat protein/O-antigen ligase
MFRPLDRRIVDRTILTAMVVAAALAAWAFGGVSPAVQTALCGLAAVVVCLSIAGEGAGRLSPVAIPALGFVALGVLQSTSLPISLLRVLSPVAAERAAWPASEPESAGASATGTYSDGPPSNCTSLNPSETRTDTALYGVTAAFFVLAATCFRRVDGVRFLLWCLVINGLLVGVFALVQKLTWDGRMFWIWPLRHGSPFGPFVNRNNAAGFLNLGLAAAAGLLVLRHHSGGGLASRVPRGKYSPGTWFPVAAAGVLAAAVVATVSRGGILGLMTGTLVAALFFGARAARGRLGLSVLAPGIAAVIVFAGGFGAALETRLGTLVDDNALAKDARVGHWKDACAAAGDFWRMGSGLGTYELAYRPHQSLPSIYRHDHADNQYLELLVEGGVPAMLLLLAGVVLLLREVVLLVTAGDSATDRALGVACGFALGSQLLQACFDFGIILPANSLAMALLTGAAVGRARALRATTIETATTPGRDDASSPPARIGDYTSKFALIGLLLLLVPSFFTLRGRSAAQAAIEASQWPADSRDVPDDEALAARLDELTGLVRDDWRQAEIHEHLGNLRIRLFRRIAVGQLAGELKISADNEALWAATNPAEIQLRALALRAAGDLEKLRQLRNDPLTLRFLTPAYHHFRAAAEVSPSRAGPWLGLAQLSFLAEDPQSYSSYLAKARVLAPRDLNVLLNSIAYDLESGRREEAVVSLRSTFQWFPDREADILKVATRRLSLLDVVKDVLADSPPELVRFYRQRLRGPSTAGERAALASRLSDSAVLRAMPSEERLFYQAVISGLQGDSKQAFESYRAAIELRPYRADWRIAFAQDLFDAGQLDEAREQAAWCVRNAPQTADSQHTLDRIVDAQKASLRQVPPK